LFLVLQWATGSTWRSLMVAALFAVHPVNVESVAWVAERKTLFSMLFFLLALAAYGRYARRPSAARYMVVAAMFALGLMAKPMVITLPCVLLLWDYWPLRRMASSRQQGSGQRTFAWLVWEKLPLFALSAASALITMRAQAKGGAVRSVREFPLTERLGNALLAYGRYVLHAFWPLDLSPMYPAKAWPAWQIGLSTLFLAAVTALVIAGRKHRYLTVGWFWFLGTLVPMIGVVQVGEQAMADRYAYLPYAGMFLMVCWGVADWAEKQRIERRWIGAASAVVLLVLVVATTRQIGYWRDNVTLWTHALQVTSNNFVAEDNLGGALLAEGRSEEAIAHFQRAMVINPSDPMSRLNVAAYDLQHGRLQRAIEGEQAVLRMTSDRGLQALAYSNLGSADRELHDYVHAKENYQAALNLAPANSQAWLGLGLVEQKGGDLTRAVADYTQATNWEPSDVGYLLLAQALEKAGRMAEAKAAEDQAERVSADLPQAEQRAKQLLTQ
ncbi:MAG: tetratricopeptide repeat protein, partial [Chlamydiota bacterium]